MLRGKSKGRVFSAGSEGEFATEKQLHWSGTAYLILKKFLSLSILCTFSCRDSDPFLTSYCLCILPMYKMLCICWQQFFASLFFNTVCQDQIPVRSHGFTPEASIYFDILVLSWVPITVYSFSLAICGIKGFLMGFFWFFGYFFCVVVVVVVLYFWFLFFLLFVWGIFFLFLEGFFDCLGLFFRF